MVSEAAIKKAAQAYVNGLATADQMTPRELAEAAWYPGCRHSVDDLEDQIRERRKMDPKVRHPKSA